MTSTRGIGARNHPPLDTSNHNRLEGRGWLATVANCQSVQVARVEGLTGAETRQSLLGLCAGTRVTRGAKVELFRLRLAFSSSTRPNQIYMAVLCWLSSGSCRFSYKRRTRSRPLTDDLLAASGFKRQTEAHSCQPPSTIPEHAVPDLKLCDSVSTFHVPRDSTAIDPAASYPTLPATVIAPGGATLSKRDHG